MPQLCCFAGRLVLSGLILFVTSSACFAGLGNATRQDPSSPGPGDVAQKRRTAARRFIAPEPGNATANYPAWRKSFCKGCAAVSLPAKDRPGKESKAGKQKGTSTGSLGSNARGAARARDKPSGPGFSTGRDSPKPWVMALQLACGLLSVIGSILLSIALTTPLVLLIALFWALGGLIWLGLLTEHLRTFNDKRANGTEAQARMQRSRKRAEWLNKSFQLVSGIGAGAGLIALVLFLLGVSTSGAPGAGLVFLVSLLGLSLAVNVLILLAAWINALIMYRIRYRSLEENAEQAK
jgi:hypothetical protein